MVGRPEGRLAPNTNIQIIFKYKCKGKYKYKYKIQIQIQIQVRIKIQIQRIEEWSESGLVGRPVGSRPQEIQIPSQTQTQIQIQIQRIEEWSESGWQAGSQQADTKRGTEFKIGHLWVVTVRRHWRCKYK